MAGPSRTSTRALALLAELEQHPERFEFHQALRLLEALDPDAPRIGRAVSVRQEGVVFGQPPELSFPSSSLAAYESRGPGRPDRLDVRCFGLFGPNGALPLHLTEYAFSRDHQEGDGAFRRFVDIFHHRMISLFYRAWADTQPAVGYRGAEEDPFGDLLGAFVGLGLPGAREGDDLPDHVRYYLAGLLSMQQRPAAALVPLLEAYLEVPVEVDEFVGEWQALPRDACRGLGSVTAGARLGIDSCIGERVWLCQGRIRVRCGPLSFARFETLLPEGPSLPGLACLLRSFVGLETLWDLCLVLRADQVPPVRLGREGRLGWSSWLGTRQEAIDADDVVLRAEGIATSAAARAQAQPASAGEL
jgi:type VI secretion system protein ImpH